MSGMYYVRFRIVDANKKVDARRVVLERKNGALLQARQVHPGEPLPRRHLRRGEGI